MPQARVQALHDALLAPDGDLGESLVEDAGESVLWLAFLLREDGGGGLGLGGVGRVVVPESVGLGRERVGVELAEGLDRVEGLGEPVEGIEEGDDLGSREQAGVDLRAGGRVSLGASHDAKQSKERERK